MKASKKAKRVLGVLKQPSILTCKVNYLFLLSHMRSRSSVLSHILGSNPDICGYRELHNSYLTYTDLLKLRINLHHELQCSLKNKYLLDKLLHDDHQISESLSEKINPKIIISLREPNSTLKSIVNMHRMRGRKNSDMEKIAHYYCKRLSQLEMYAQRYSGNFFFLESDALISQTSQALSSLSEWLVLKEPLKPEYEFFRKTGKRRSGDPSANIKAGKLVQTEDYSDILIPEAILSMTRAAYEQCYEQLIELGSISVTK